MVCRRRHKPLSAVSATAWAQAQLQGLCWKFDSSSSSFGAAQMDTEGMEATGLCVQRMAKHQRLGWGAVSTFCALGYETTMDSGTWALG